MDTSREGDLGTSSSSENIPENYTAFMVRACAPSNSAESSGSENKKEESSESEAEENLDEEVDVEEAYEQLYQDCRKLHKQNEKLTVKNKMLKRERDSLKVALEELQKRFEDLESSKKPQEELMATLKKKLEQREKEAKEAQEKIETMQSKRSSSSSKLDDLLAIQRSPNDKSGLGYTGEKRTTKNASSSGQKIKNIRFQPTKPSSNQVERLPAQASKKLKGNKPTFKSQKSQGTPFTAPRKFVPTCHHCGIVGHIRPNCHKLYGPPPSYVDTRNFLKPNFQVSNRYNPLRVQKSYFNSNPYMTWPVRTNIKKNFSNHIGPNSNKPMTQNVSQKVRTIWVRKSDLYVTHTPKNVEGVSLDA